MKSLAMSYAMKRRSGKMKPAEITAPEAVACPTCKMAHGGPACMAEGGEVVDRDLAADTASARSSLALPKEQTAKAHMEAAGTEMPEVEPLHQMLARLKKPVKMAQGGLVDEIMAARRPAPEPEETLEMGPDAENAEEPSVDFSNYHSMDDAEHDNIPADDTDSLIGQILEARRAKRRGL